VGTVRRAFRSAQLDSLNDTLAALAGLETVRAFLLWAQVRDDDPGQSASGGAG